MINKKKTVDYVMRERDMKKKRIHMLIQRYEDLAYDPLHKHPCIYHKWQLIHQYRQFELHEVVLL